jgi:23S rRNA (cytosine1962-C5)-methyltransferase
MMGLMSETLPVPIEPRSPGGYALLDAGVLRRLERFGSIVVDRPAPMATAFRQQPDAWPSVDLRFDAGPGWSGPAWPIEPWTVDIEGVTLELRPTASGGLGIYPEHAGNVAWLAAAVAARHEPQVLNLFAHTGLATLALARSGAAVAHVDAARSAVAWARRNAELSGLADRPIRWLVDDVAAFVAREARRGRRYDGIVLDPPAFGRAKGREWHIEEDLPELLAACRAIAAQGAFVLLTAHSSTVEAGELAAMVRSAFRGMASKLEVVPMTLTAESGVTLELGWAVRVGG